MTIAEFFLSIFHMSSLSQNYGYVRACVRVKQSKKKENQREANLKKRCAAKVVKTTRTVTCKRCNKILKSILIRSLYIENV